MAVDGEEARISFVDHMHGEMSVRESPVLKLLSSLFCLNQGGGANCIWSLLKYGIAKASITISMPRLKVVDSKSNLYLVSL